jgi:hypothetical protein
MTVNQLAIPSAVVIKHDYKYYGAKIIIGIIKLRFISWIFKNPMVGLTVAPIPALIVAGSYGEIAAVFTYILEVILIFGIMPLNFRLTRLGDSAIRMLLVTGDGEPMTDDYGYSIKGEPLVYTPLELQDVSFNVGKYKQVDFSYDVVNTEIMELAKKIKTKKEDIIKKEKTLAKINGDYGKMNY